MAPTSTAVFRAVADFQSLNRSVKQTRAEIEKLQRQSGKTGEWEKFDASLQKVGETQKKLRAETKLLNAEQAKLGRSSGTTNLANSLGRLTTATDKARTSTTALSAAQGRQQGVLKQNRDNITSLTTAMRSLSAAEDSATKSAQNHAKSLADERNSADQKTSSLNKLSDALHKNAARDRDAASSADMHAEALQRESISAQVATDRNRELGVSTTASGRAAKVSSGDHDLLAEALARLTPAAAGAQSSLRGHASSASDAGSSSRSAAAGQSSLADALDRIAPAARNAATSSRSSAGSFRDVGSSARTGGGDVSRFENAMRGVGSTSRSSAGGVNVLGGALNPLKSSLRSAGEAGAGLKTILAGLTLAAAVPGITLLIGSLSALVSGLVAVVAAAGPAVGALAALGPAAIAAAGAIATTMLAFRGVGDALKAMTKVEKESATGAVDAAKQRQTAARAIGAAQRGVRDAIQSQQDAERQGARAVADAQRALDRARADAAEAAVQAARRVEDSNDDLIRANQAVIRAEQDLHDARRQAIRDLEDLAERTGDNVLSLEGAEIRLLRAQERLNEINADSKSTALDRREAILALREAEDNLSDVQRQSARDASDLSAAQKAGVNGMPGVVSAQDSLSGALDSQRMAARDLKDAQAATAKAQADSAERIGDAERNLAEAREDAARRNSDAAERVEDALLRLAEAQAASTESSGAMSAASRDLAAALEKLSPQGLRLVAVLKALQPRLNEMSKTAQEAMFPGLIRALEILTPLIDTVAIPSLDAFGRALGWVASTAATEVASWEKDLVDFGTGAGPQLIREFGQILVNLLGAMEDVGVAATPLLKWLTSLGVRLSEYWEREAQAGRRDGTLADYFDRVRATLELLGDIIFNVGGILKEVFAGASPTGTGLLQDFENLTRETRAWMGTAEGKNAISEYFRKVRPNFELVLEILGKIAKAFIDVGASSTLTTLLQSVRDVLGPSLGRFIDAMGESLARLGPQLVDLLAGVLDFFSTLAESGSGGGLAAFVTVIGTIVDVLNAIVSVPLFAWLISAVLAFKGATLAMKAFGKVASAIPGATALNRALGTTGTGATTVAGGVRAGLGGSSNPAATGTARAGQAAGAAVLGGVRGVGGLFGGRGAPVPAPAAAPTPVVPRALPVGSPPPRALPAGPNRPMLPPGGLGPIAPPYRPQPAPPNPPGTLARGGPLYPRAFGGPLPPRGPIALGNGATMGATPRSQVGSTAPDPAKLNAAAKATQSLNTAQQAAARSAGSMGSANAAAAGSVTRVGSASTSAAASTGRLGSAAAGAAGGVRGVGSASAQAAAGASRLGSASQSASRDVRAVGATSTTAAGQVRNVGSAAAASATTSTKAFSGVGSRIGSAFSSAGSAAGKAFSGVTGAATSAASKVTGAFSSVAGKIGAAMAPTSARVTSALAPTTSAATTAAGRVSGAFSSVASRVGTALAPVASRVTSALAPATAAATSAATRVSGAFSGVGSRIASAFAPASTAARTLGSTVSTAAQQAEQAGRRISTGLAASATAAGTALRGVGSAAQAAGAQVRGIGSAAGGAASGVGALGSAAGTAAAGAGGMRSALGGLSSFLGGPWGIAMAGALIAFTLFTQHQKAAEERTRQSKQAQEDFKQALDESRGALDQNTLAVARNAVEARTINGSNNSLADAAKRAGVGVEDMTRAITMQGPHLDGLRSKLQQTVDSHTFLLNASEATGTGLNSTNTYIDATGQAAANTLVEVDKLTAEFEAQRIKSLELRAGINGVTVEQQSLADAIVNTHNKLLESLNSDLAKQQSLLDVKTAQKDYNDAVTEFGVNSDQAREADIRMQQTMLSHMVQAGETAAKQAEMNGVIDTTRIRMEAENQAALNLAASHNGPLPEALQKVITGMDATSLAAAGARVKIDETGTAVVTLPDGKTITLRDNAPETLERLKSVQRYLDEMAEYKSIELRIDTNQYVGRGAYEKYAKGPPAPPKGGGIVGNPMHFAGGGVVPGYRPGYDSVDAVLSPGEAVLVPELVKKIGARNILAANREASGRAPVNNMGSRFASGGIVGRTTARGGTGVGGTAAPSPVDAAGATAAAKAIAALTGQMASLTPQLRAAQLAGTQLVSSSLQPLAQRLGVDLVSSLSTLRESGLLPLRSDLALTQRGTEIATQAMTGAMALHDRQANAALANLRSSGLAPLRSDLTTTQAHEQTTTTAMTNAVNLHRDLSNAALLNIRTLGLNPLRTDLTTTQLHEQNSTTAMTDAMNLHRDLSNAAMLNVRQLGLLPLRTDLTTTQQGTQANTGLMSNSVEQFRDRANLALSLTRDGLTQTRTSVGETQSWWTGQMNLMKVNAQNPVRDVLNGPFNGGIIAAWNSLNTQFSLGKAVNPVAVPFATGGAVPGTGNRDSVPAVLTPGEFVLSKRAIEGLGGLQNVERLHQLARMGILGPNQHLGRGSADGRDRQQMMRKVSLDDLPVPFAYGGVAPHVAAAGDEIQRVFGRMPGGIGGVGSRGNVSDHPKGLALDFMTMSDQGLGDRIANYMVGNAARMAVKYLIWKQSINQGSGWSGMEDRGSVTANHMDHVHASFLGNGVAGSPFSGGGAFFDPGPIVDAAFASTYSMLDGVAAKYPNEHAARIVAIGRQAADMVKAKAMETVRSVAALSFGGGAGAPVSGDTVAQVRSVAARYGWGEGPQWDALSRIIQKESSWNPGAANPNSSARGLFQKMTSIHGPVEPTAGGQAQWGLNYIKGRYGDPVSALRFHNANNYYAKGGYVPGRGNGDTEPAMLTPGEFVIRRSAAEALGPGTLDALNALRPGAFSPNAAQHMALGGVVSRNGGLAYQIKGGDTLSGIARSYGTSIAELQRLNKIPNPNRIYAGHWLNLPGHPTAAASPSPSGSADHYQVQWGDTLTGVARRFDTSVQELQRLNNISDPNKIYAGAWLSTPKASGSKIDAARAIKDRFHYGLPIYEDWTWHGQPSYVGKYNDELLDLYKKTGVVANRSSEDWLSEYISKGGKITPPPTPKPTSPATDPDDASSTEMSLEQWAAGLAKNTANTKEFESNLLKLSSWGYDDLALALAKMGMESTGTDKTGGLSLSRQAVKSPSAAAAVEKIVEDSKTVIGENLEHALSVIGALRKTAGLGIREVSTATKIDTKDIFETMAQGRVLQEVSKLPAANRDKFMSNLDAYKKGLPFAIGGRVPGSGRGDTVPAMLTPGEFVLRKDAAKAIGIQSLERLNKADSLPAQAFAGGGEVLRAEDLFSFVGAPKASRLGVGRGVQQKLAAAIGRSGDTTNSKSVVFNEGAVKVMNPAPARSVDSFESVMQKLTWAGAFS